MKSSVPSLWMVLIWVSEHGTLPAGSLPRMAILCSLRYVRQVGHLWCWQHVVLIASLHNDIHTIVLKPPAK